jgi:hypothetical protein
VNARIRNLLGNTALVIGSMFFVFLVMECWLWADSLLDGPGSNSVTVSQSPAVPTPASNEGFHIPPRIIATAEARQKVKVMPDEWQHRDVSIPGAAHAYYWQGVLHVLDQNGFRRAAPFPPKDPNVFRVIVVGDSLTFGYGIAEKDTFVGLLNRWLQNDYRIELLNLGVSSLQSEDILGTIRKFLPQLHPNLALYAVCLNDFLPSGVNQYEITHPFPLPEKIKTFLIAHTRTGAFLNDKYDAALRGVHLRRDFYDDILRDFSGYQKRFRRDVMEMNAVVKAAGLPPMIGLVLDQYPSYSGRGYRITQTAERALKDAGAEVIPTENYYRRYNNQSMNVSNWEGHPNEVANYIWATMIMDRLRQRPDLARYTR